VLDCRAFALAASESLRQQLYYADKSKSLVERCERFASDQLPEARL
jgi:hypothetical protein